MIKSQSQDHHYQLLISQIQHYFKNSTLVLQDDRNTIKEIEFAQKTLIVKSFKIPILLNRFVYSYCKKSKAKRAYEFGLKITQFTPKAIAYIEYYQWTLLHKSYFICEKFNADFNMQTPLFKNHPDKIIIFKAFAQFVYQLHQQDIVHQDLSPGNILIKQNAQNYEFKIIDINRMIFKSPNFKQRAKNFNKLWANDDDLALILAEYARLAGLEKDCFIGFGLKYNQQLKRRKTRKRKIKQILGLC